jgi:small-conductance mechanosensitive channel
MTNELSHLVETTTRAVDSVVRTTKPEEWAWFAGVVSVGLLVVWGLDRLLFLLVVKRLQARGVAAARYIGRAARAPLAVAVFVAFMNRAKDSFQAMPPQVWQLLENLAPFVYGFAAVLFSLRVVDVAVETLRSRYALSGADVDEQMLTFVARASKGFVMVVALVVLLDQMGVKVLGLVTGLGFLGAAIALASQSTFANLIGSIEILADRLFKVGDRIAFADYDGFVTRMGIRSVELVSLSGERINLPNKDLVDKQIRNYTRGRFVRTTLTVGITYNNTRAGVERAMTALNEVFEAVKARKDVPALDRYEVVFRGFGASQLDLMCIFWADYRTTPDFNRIVTEVNLAIKEKFDAAGITFAFPTQTLQIERPARPLA